MLTNADLYSAFLATLATAFIISIMTIFKLPISTSQAIIGAIIGIGFFNHQYVFPGLTKIYICWIGTPISGILLSIILYFLISPIINNLNLNLFVTDFILRIFLIVGGAYGAYALGANNVANVVGVFAKSSGITPKILSLIGSFSIVAGVLRNSSKNVMFTIGENLVPLEAFPAVIAIFAQAITVHVFAKIGVPVSTSQAIIGAVLGIGIIKGMHTINLKILIHIIIGWISTPVLSGVLSFLLLLIFYHK